MSTCRAYHLALLEGAALVGREVITPAMGDYPGGRAVVTQMFPDPAAPEIVFTVAHPTWKDDDGKNDMGIFEYEEVQLIPK